jgi:hypothetical protein
LNSLDIVDTLTASSVIASNLYTKIETDELLANLSSNSDGLDSKQDIITPTTPIACAGLTVLGDLYGTSFKAGSSATYLKMTDGHHIDCFNTVNNTGRLLWLQYFANSDLRVGNRTSRFGINTDPTFNLHVVGNAYISSTLNVNGDFTAPNIYNKSEVDSLLSSYAPTIADGSLAIAKTEGLNDALLTKASVSSLVAGLSSKQDKIDSFSTLNISSINTIDANVSGTLNCGLTTINVSSSGSSQF